MNLVLWPICLLLANLATGFYNALMSLAEWSYLEGKRLEWPAPWARFFGRSAPLMLEIGFGNGQFLLDLAARRPEANIVGIEIAQPSLRNAQRKVTRANLRNVLLVHASARQALWTLFAPQSLAAVTINFPDPWPKAGQQSRRLVNRPFLALLAARMQAGATLDIATDIASYAAEIAAHLQQSAQFDNRLPQPFVHEVCGRLRTKYETIALNEGRRCAYFQWRRNRAPVQDLFTIPQELDMPHLVLTQTPPLAALAAGFRPATHTDARGIVRFVDIFLDSGQHALLVDTYIDEAALTQRLGLHLRARQDGTAVIGLHELGHPRATPGVHRAIDLLANTFIGRHPQIRVVSSNLVID